MKKSLLFLLPLFVWMLSVTTGLAQCNAQFTWEQIPGTLQIHFNSTSTSEFDIVSYQWNFGDGQMGDGSNPYHTYEEAGNYLVCLIIEDSEGCISDICHEITVEAVNSECNASFIWEQIPGSLEIHFHSTSTSEHDIISYQWNFGDGQMGEGSNPYHTYEEPGTYLVCLIITDAVGCVSDICHEVTVEAASGECNASFIWEQIPGSLEIHFHSTSTSEHDIVSYQWNFGDGHTGDGSNPYHTYEEPGTYLVCLRIEDTVGCVSEICHEVTVEGIPSECNASFIWEQFNGTLEVDFTSTSTSDHDIISFVWNFGDGHMGEGPNPSHTYDEPGTYLVCLIIENAEGCVSDVCHEVTVEEASSECHASFTWEQIGGSLEIIFHSTSTSEHDIISYSWNFGDGQIGDGPNPHHTYEEPGTYLVCLRIEDVVGCVSEICHEVIVEGGSSECHASFTWEQIGGSLEIIFHSTSTSEHDIISFSWNFGDGHVGDGPNPHHVYEEPGTYLVCLRIEDAAGCVSEVCHEVIVEEGASECHASFTWEQVGGSLEIIFHSTSTSEHDIISYSWNFGDGQIGDGPNPHHVYNEPGTYLVCLRIEDAAGCVSEICHEIIVEGGASECHASFTWEQVGGSLEIIFHSTSTSEHDIISYHWIFGDGHEGDGANPHHTYDEPGTYLVCLIITDAAGCVSDICHEVTVEGQNQECEAAFNFEEDDFGVIHFNNNSSGSTPHTTWLWDFGDGETSTEENPEHEYDEPGIYTVCLTMTDTTTDCSDDFCLSLTYALNYEDLYYNEVPEFSQFSATASGLWNEDFIVLRYTNPASGEIEIEYYMDSASTITFELYDLVGYKWISKISGPDEKGKHKETLNIGHVPPGLYLLMITKGVERISMGVYISE